jgi:hypothetical protein
MCVRLIAKEVEDNGKFEIRNQKFEKSGRGILAWRGFGAGVGLAVKGRGARKPRPKGVLTQRRGGAEEDAEEEHPRSTRILLEFATQRETRRKKKCLRKE